MPPWPEYVGLRVNEVPKLMWGGVAGLVVFRKHKLQHDALLPGKGVECHTLEHCSQKFSLKKWVKLRDAWWVA